MARWLLAMDSAVNVSCLLNHHHRKRVSAAVVVISNHLISLHWTVTNAGAVRPLTSAGPRSRRRSKRWTDHRVLQRS